MRATAYVLINLATGVAEEVYSTLGKMEYVQQVNAISGPYDMIALVDGPTFNDLAKFVLDKIQKLPGVQKTITCNVIFLEN
ncbi:MAG: Lrp/AsnC ligand binding domain-containing protein [bacterium]|nr:MAG: Lrp/AsnC ligand binding domain-containing protein [bacterium]